VSVIQVMSDDIFSQHTHCEISTSVKVNSVLASLLTEPYNCPLLDSESRAYNSVG